MIFSRRASMVPSFIRDSSTSSGVITEEEDIVLPPLIQTVSESKFERESHRSNQRLIEGEFRKFFAFWFLMLNWIWFSISTSKERLGFSGTDINHINRDMSPICFSFVGHNPLILPKGPSTKISGNYTTRPKDFTNEI